jgi:predicted DNA-binding transcriptional regulator YafY
MLSFGDKVKVIEPVEVTQEIKTAAQNMLKLYEAK